MTVGIFTPRDNVQFRSQSLCLRIKFTRLPLIILDILIRNVKIHCDRLTFLFPFLPRKGGHELFFKILQFFLHPLLAGKERRKEKIDNLHGLKYYYSRDTFY